MGVAEEVEVGVEVEMEEEEEEARPVTARVVRERGSSEPTIQSISADTRRAHETVLAVQCAVREECFDARLDRLRHRHLLSATAHISTQ